MALTSSIIFLIGGLICHQRPERSFFLAGHQLPVCARCTGLYLSAAVGLVAWLVLKAGGWRPGAIDPRVARTVFIVAALPTVVSLSTGALGMWDGSNLTRAIFAAPLGATAGAIVAAVVAKDLR